MRAVDPQAQGPVKAALEKRAAGLALKGRRRRVGPSWLAASNAKPHDFVVSQTFYNAF